MTTSFYGTVLRNSKAFRSDAVCKDPGLLEPGTRAAVVALVAEATAEGHDVRLLETYRSQTRQSALYTQRKTQLRVVGCHGYGVAADLGVFLDGKYAVDNAPYVFLRDLARKHGLISGQDWGHVKPGSFVDSGHVQRVPVWRQGELFAGTWYPPADYDPYADSLAHGRRDVVGQSRGPDAGGVVDGRLTRDPAHRTATRPESRRQTPKARRRRRLAGRVAVLPSWLTNLL